MNNDKKYFKKLYKNAVKLGNSEQKNKLFDNLIDRFCLL